MYENKVIQGSNCEISKVNFLWYPYVAFGKVTLLSGEPGKGKSSLILKIAAMLSNGENMPFSNSKNECLNTLYLSSEDDFDDTILFRFKNFGGNPDHLFSIDESVKTVTIDDIAFEKAIADTNAKLVVIDPLAAYVGKRVSMNAATATRARFQRLKTIAKQYGCAIVVVNHLNKGSGKKALYRSSGSIDIVGAARSGLFVGTAPSGVEGERVMIHFKSNLTCTGKSIHFLLHHQRVDFIKQSDLTDEDVISESACNLGRPPRSKEEAKTLIEELFSKSENNQILASDVICKAAEIGISLKTLDTAKKEIDIKSQKINKQWYWVKPTC